MNNTLKYLIYTLLFALFLILRWNTISLPLERDEGEYFYAAKLIKENLPIYKNAFIQKPPFTFYIYRIALFFGDWSVQAVRLISIIFIFTSALILEKRLNNLFTPTILTIGLFSIPVPYLWVNSANTELFLVLPSTILLYLSIKPDRQIIKGIIGSICLMIKPIALPLVFGFFIYDLYMLSKMQFTFYERLKSSLLYFLSFVSTSLIIMLPILIKQDLAFFIESVITFNWHYMSAYDGTSWVSNLNFFFKIFNVLMILALIGIAVSFKRNIMISIIFVLSIIIIGKAQIPRYYVFLFPFAILLISHAINKILRNHKSLSIIVSLLLITYTLHPYRNHFFENNRNLNAFLYPNQCNQEVYDFTQQFAKINSEIDTIYIAGSEPQIHHYLNTFNPGRFITKYPLMLDTKLNLKFQQQERNMLNEKPRYIALIKNPQSWLGDKKTPQLYINSLNKRLLDYDNMNDSINNRCLKIFKLSD